MTPPHADGRDSRIDGFDSTRTNLKRRQTLRSLGLLLAGGAAATTVSTEPASGQTSDFDPKAWQSDAVPDTPVHELSFPGTHHAAMVNPTPDSPEYYDCQTNEVYRQLCDGIRFLDVRVESQGDAETTNFYGHHSTESGRSLDNEVFPQIEQYLSEVDLADASELVLLKLSHFYDEGIFSDEEFEADDWRNLTDLLQTHFGDYAVDLGAMASTDELLDATLSEFDGPKIAIFYRTLKEHDSPLSLPGFTDRWGDWVDSYYPDTSTPGNVLAGGVTNEHTDTDKLGETQWIVRAPADLYTDGPATNDMLTLFEEVVETFSLVAENTDETNSGIEEIRDTTDQQAASTEQAVSMIEDVAEISRSTAEETDRASAAARQQTGSMSRVSDSTGSLVERAERLQALLGTFDVNRRRDQTAD